MNEYGKTDTVLPAQPTKMMKYKLLIAICAGAGLAVAAPEAPTAAAGSIPDWLDTDGDGVVSEIERQAFAEARRGAPDSLQTQWDTNGDGVIDAEEKAAAIAELKAKARAKLSELFLIAAGEDEVLTLEEFKALAPDGMPENIVEPLFELLDADKNGEVTLDEFLAATYGGSSSPPSGLPGIPSAP